MEPMERIQKAHKALCELVIKEEGPSKMSSGELGITFGMIYPDIDQKIFMTFEGYDIAHWSRHCSWGPFKSLEEAAEHVEKMVEKAKQDIRSQEIDREIEAEFDATKCAFVSTECPEECYTCQHYGDESVKQWEAKQCTS